ncbi:hypothetical protein MCETHM1_01789 [Flavobacteriaceae bacterium]
MFIDTIPTVKTAGYVRIADKTRSYKIDLLRIRKKKG